MQHPQKRKKPSAKSSRKRTAVFLTVGLLLAVLFVLVVPSVEMALRGNKGSIYFNPPGAETLDEGDANDLLSIAVTPKEGDGYTLIYQNERLHLQKNGALAPIDENLSQRITEVATMIVVEDSLSEDMEEISE